MLFEKKQYISEKSTVEDNNCIKLPIIESMVSVYVFFNFYNYWSDVHDSLILIIYRRVLKSYLV